MTRKIILGFIFLLFLLIIILSSVKYNSKKIYYFSKEDRLICEKTEFFSGLNFLYNNFFGRIFRDFLNKKFVSKISAIFLDSSLSKYKIKSFIKKYNINSNEFLENTESFKSFNDFFIRKLKKDSRPFDVNPNIIISPADSKIFVISDISKDTEFFVKNQKFNLLTFLKDDQLAEKYKNGVMLIFRLSPQDYHRYHFPFDCVPSFPVFISGNLDSVNTVVYKSGFQPLYENERQIIKLNKNIFSEVILVCVGAMFVGRIIQTYRPEIEYKKGDEIGYFQFGGSTLVLLFEKDKIKVKTSFLKNSLQGFETEIKMGETICD